MTLFNVDRIVLWCPEFGVSFGRLAIDEKKRGETRPLGGLTEVKYSILIVIK